MVRVRLLSTSGDGRDLAAVQGKWTLKMEIPKRKENSKYNIVTCIFNIHMYVPAFVYYVTKFLICGVHALLF